MGCVSAPWGLLVVLRRRWILLKPPSMVLKAYRGRWEAGAWHEPRQHLMARFMSLII
ncbi:hypothetical protein BDA96_05G187800 [Sorghum bicolor]|uniref:Uncharacterized protein n=1 Tax=Sorghum bicolor TaxID=4558 RepID=A0A921UG90_SORBI|nr:hypothetical protein BDA96_05G187800 [Sorghum bicolor]